MVAEGGALVAVAVGRRVAGIGVRVFVGLTTVGIDVGVRVVVGVGLAVVVAGTAVGNTVGDAVGIDWGVAVSGITVEVAGSAQDT